MVVFIRGMTRHASKLICFGKVGSGGGGGSIVIIRIRRVVGWMYPRYTVDYYFYPQYYSTIHATVQLLLRNITASLYFP